MRISMHNPFLSNLNVYFSGEHLLEIAKGSESAPDLASAISNSDLATFLFPDDFIQKLFDIVHR